MEFVDYRLDSENLQSTTVAPPLSDEWSALICCDGKFWFFAKAWTGVGFLSFITKRYSNLTCAKRTRTNTVTQLTLVSMEGYLMPYKIPILQLAGKWPEASRIAFL